jgi:hypothetical protein
MKSLFNELFYIEGKEGEVIYQETKVCSKCKQTLSTHMFGKASGGNYLRGECRACSKEVTIAREKAKLTAPKIPNNYQCPVCQRTEEQVKHRGGKKSGTWCCDHSHTTGLFRGWLCHDCNRGIGNLGDDINRLKRAMEYVSEN